MLKATDMKCVICRQGETKPDTSTAVLDREGVTLVLRNVPAEVCQTCGEAFFSEEVTRRMLEVAEQVACAAEFESETP